MTQRVHLTIVDRALVSEEKFDRDDTFNDDDLEFDSDSLEGEDPHAISRYLAFVLAPRT